MNRIHLSVFLGFFSLISIPTRAVDSGEFSSKPGQTSAACAETLADASDLMWFERLNAQLATPTFGRAPAEMRWATLEFLFKHRDRRPKIDPVLLKLLDRIAAGETEILELPESAPYVSVLREEIPEQSQFLSRIQREQEPLVVAQVPLKKLSQVLAHKQKSLGRFKRLGMQLGLLGQKFDRLDAFLSEMRSYPQAQDRRDFYIATVPSLSPLTWPEVLQAMDVFENPADQKAVAQAALPYIFTPGEIFAAPIAERVAKISEDLKHQEKDVPGPAQPFGKKFRKRAIIGAIGLGLTGVGVKLGADYFSPQQTQSRVAKDALARAQLQSRAMADEQRAWRIMGEGAQHWREIQAFYAKAQGIDEMAQLARVVDSPELSEEITLRHAAALAPILKPADYAKLIAGSHSIRGSEVLHWSLWVHYLRVNQDRLTLDEANHLLSYYFPRQPDVTIYEKGAIYLDYVLPHVQESEDWWSHAVEHAPDTATGDAIAFAFLKMRGARLTPEQIDRFLGKIRNTTLRDRAVRMTSPL